MFIGAVTFTGSIVPLLSVTMRSSVFVSAALPPLAAATSTVTEPLRVAATIPSVISFGAGDPGSSLW